MGLTLGIFSNGMHSALSANSEIHVTWSSADILLILISSFISLTPLKSSADQALPWCGIHICQPLIGLVAYPHHPIIMCHQPPVVCMVGRLSVGGRSWVLVMPGSSTKTNSSACIMLLVPLPVLYCNMGGHETNCVIFGHSSLLAGPPHWRNPCFQRSNSGLKTAITKSEGHYSHSLHSPKGKIKR